VYKARHLAIKHSTIIVDLNIPLFIEIYSALPGKHKINIEGESLYVKYASNYLKWLSDVAKNVGTRRRNLWLRLLLLYNIM
jgi:hypothetical protein